MKKQKSIEKIMKKLFTNMPLIFGVGILLVNLVAILAPILAHLGFTDIAHWIYMIYQFLCHQRSWRSLHLFDYQVAWCSRDTFIYLSMGLAAFFVVKFKLRNVKWYVPLLAILPFALDGIIQLIAEVQGFINHEELFFYASTNFVRMLTGSIFGAGAGIWIFSLLAETIDEEFGRKLKVFNQKSKLRNCKYFLLIVIICLISYLGFIQAWRVTSTKYRPSGLLDHVRYYPGVNYDEEAERCGHCV